VARLALALPALGEASRLHAAHALEAAEVALAGEEGQEEGDDHGDEGPSQQLHPYPLGVAWR
jgi:hypothetical protein